MQKEYDAPGVAIIGEADEVIMGAGGSGLDFPFQSGWDFEFEQD
jgi:hypothetical protein